jgi:hypothetical protein
MQGVLPVKWAVLVQFQFFLGVSPVFLGGVVLPLAFGTLQGDEFNRRLFACHISTP